MKGNSSSRKHTGNPQNLNRTSTNARGEILHIFHGSRMWAKTSQCLPCLRSARTHARTHALTHRHRHRQTQTQTAHTHTHTHTHTHAHTHTHTYTHTYTHTAHSKQHTHTWDVKCCLEQRQSEVLCMTHTNGTRSGYVTEWGREGRGEGNEEEGYVVCMDRPMYVVVQYVYAWIVYNVFECTCVYCMYVCILMYVCVRMITTKHMWMYIYIFHKAL